MKISKMKIKVLTIILAAFLLAGCGQGSEAENDASEISSVQESESGEQEAAVGGSESADATASDTEEPPYVLTFEATTIEGEPMTSDCFAGSKLTMINIWGTYCNPCLMEMPDLGEIAASYDAADFQLIGIICDVMEGADEADIENAKALIEETGAAYPHLLLSESLYVNLVGATDSVPTTFFVNDKGEVLGYVVGANSKETWVNLIEQLLAETE